MIKDLSATVRPALVMTGLYAVLLGLAYPAALTGVSALVFPHQSGGSLVQDKGQVIGSELLGQSFASPRYFHGRPSAAGKGYDAAASAGSNLAPFSLALHDRVAPDVAAVLASNPASPASPVPPDLVTTSASGLDPHISPEAAFYQVSRVAQARGLAPGQVHALVAAQVEQPLLGLLGEPRVNVLALNRALDALVLDEKAQARAKGRP